MAIYLSRKKGGTVATPITPSNSSPAQMTANVAVNPTGNGYAIASYNTKTPSNSSPVALTSGEIDKIGGNGYAIESYNTIFPPAVSPERIEYGKIYKALDDGYAIGYLPIEVYPSNEFPDILQEDRYYQAKGRGYVIESYDSIIPSSTPKSISQGDMVYINGSGVIVNSIPTPTSITPSNSSPVALTANTPVNPTASGYAISSYSSKTPSDSSPASVSSGAIIKASASGYLYSTVQPKVKIGTFQTSTSGEVTVTLGFQPKYLAFEGDGSTSSGKHFMYIYNADTSTSVCYFANASNYPTTRSMTSGANNIVITSTGFKFTMTTSPVRTCRYFAIG